MTYMYGMRQTNGASVCGACARQHQESKGPGLFVPKGCNCTCHNMDYRKVLLPPIRNAGDKYRLDDTTAFAEYAKAYFSGEGKRLDAYLEGKGRSAYELTGVGTTGLDGAIAAALIDGDNVRIAGDTNFEERVRELEQHYNVKSDVVQRYILDHENVHRWQRGKEFKSELESELDVEETLITYYDHLKRADPGKKGLYESLGMIASDRAKNVSRNYAPQKDSYESFGESVAA